jgi:ribulose-phosphate 3-epimerase
MKQTPFIAPSILAADFARLGEEVEAVLAAGADVIHFDVMDNHYVPNLTVGPMVLTALRKAGIQATMDVHLMVRPVDALIEAFAEAGADWITFHPEASDHIDRSLALAHSAGLKTGLVFNPATPLSYLDYTLESIDMVLLMSVNPGFGGQSFIPGTLVIHPGDPGQARRGAQPHRRQRTRYPARGRWRHQSRQHWRCGGRRRRYLRCRDRDLWSAGLCGDHC